MNYLFKTFLYSCCLPGLLVAMTCSLHAQTDDQQALNEVVSGIKNLKTYSYEAAMVAMFPNGQQDEIVNKVYMDAPHKCLRYSNKTQIVILNKKWFYRADHASHTVSIFNVVTYSKKTRRDPEELNNVFKGGNVIDFFLDSVLAKQAKIKSISVRDDRISIAFDFGARSHIKDFQIVYNREQQLPELIKMTTIYRNEGAGNDKNNQTTMSIVCRNYSGTIAQEVFSTDKYFRLINGKISLLQYKNYKVSSIL